MQSLVEIELRAMVVGAKIWCLFFMFVTLLVRRAVRVYNSKETIW